MAAYSISSMNTTSKGTLAVRDRKVIVKVGVSPGFIEAKKERSAHVCSAVASTVQTLQEVPTMRRWVGALAAVLGQTLFVSGFVPPLAPGGDRVAMQARLVCSARMEAPSVRRREALLSIGIGLATTIVSQPSSATPVRAPLPPGPADPADWATLTKAAGTAAAWGEDLEDPASWQGIAEQVKKAPFTQESMDLMFRKAAKNLPANALLGSDAGYWAGVRVEAMEAMDAFAVEVLYLNDAEKKKKGSGDASDLKGYHETLVAKMQEFIAIKDDIKICKRCAGQTVGGSVDAEKAKVKEFSEEERVRFGKD